jgi:uncharacterized OB-fold protein
MASDHALMGEEHSTALSQPYWEQLRAGRLVLQRCSECGHWQHFPRVLCLKCNRTRLAWTAVQGDGEAVATTLVHRTLNEALQDRVPYLIALVRLREGPLIMALGPTDIRETAGHRGHAMVFDPLETRRTGLLTFGHVQPMPSIG